jgi:4-hydroxy-tetrahydrodipicolinate synthase
MAYYKLAVEAIGGDVPFVLQDYPLTFSVVMTPEVIRRIVMENDSCVMRWINATYRNPYR